MITPKQYDITAGEEAVKKHVIATPIEKETDMCENILECPYCTSLLRIWYQPTVTRVTCPKCWAEIPVEYLQINRFEAAIMNA